MDSFMGKFSGNDRPQLTPSEPRNILPDILPGQGNPPLASSVQSFFSNVAATNSHTKLKQRKESISDNYGNELGRNEILKTIASEAKLNRQVFTPGSSAPSRSSLVNLLGQNQSKISKDNDKCPSDFNRILQQASIVDGNILRGMEINDTQSDRVNGGKTKKASLSTPGGPYATGNRRTSKSGKHGKRSESNTYMQFSKVDTLNTPQARDSSNDHINAEKSSSLALGKPSVLCCQYSMDKEESIRSQAIKNSNNPITTKADSTGIENENPIFTSSPRVAEVDHAQRDVENEKAKFPDHSKAEKDNTKSSLAQEVIELDHDESKVENDNIQCSSQRVTELGHDHTKAGNDNPNYGLSPEVAELDCDHSEVKSDIKSDLPQDIAESAIQNVNNLSDNVKCDLSQGVVGLVHACSDTSECVACARDECLSDTLLQESAKLDHYEAGIGTSKSAENMVELDDGCSEVENVKIGLSQEVGGLDSDPSEVGNDVKSTLSQREAKSDNGQSEVELSTLKSALCERVVALDDGHSEVENDVKSHVQGVVELDRDLSEVGNDKIKPTLSQGGAKFDNGLSELEISTKKSAQGQRVDELAHDSSEVENDIKSHSQGVPELDRDLPKVANDNIQSIVSQDVPVSHVEASENMEFMNIVQSKPNFSANFPENTLGESLLMSGKDDTTLVSEAAEYKPKFIGEMKLGEERAYAPVDVAKSSMYVFATSQATNSVAVFKDYKFIGVLKLPERKPFNSPHNVTFIAPYSSNPHADATLSNSDEQPANQSSKKIKKILAAGCLVVLDNDGFHIFTEEGEFVLTLMKGEGMKFRGLALYSPNPPECSNSPQVLYLLTINISKPDIAYLALIDIEKAMATGGKAGIDMDWIGIEPTRTTMGLMDQRHKCRFLACGVGKNSSKLDQTFGPSSSAFDDTKKHYVKAMVYITGLQSKQIYSVNLNTKESNIVKLTYPTPKMINSTFADQTLNMNGTGNITFVPQDPNITMTTLMLRTPTGIQVDEKGNLLVADRNSNEIYVLSPSGVLIKSLLKSDKGIEETMTDKPTDGQFQPVGICFDHKERDLYVCSNRNKRILHCRL